MKNLSSFLIEESEIFGPGTDLVISLAAILMIAMVINSNVCHEEINKVTMSCQELQQCQDCPAQLEVSERRLQELQTKYQDCQTQLEYCERQKEYDKKYRQCEADKRKLEKVINESGRGQLDITEVKKNQMEIVNKIAAQYHTQPLEVTDGEETYGISTANNGQPDILIQNDVTLQRITFGEQVLFEQNESELKSSGMEVLKIVGNIFKKRLQSIREIQIQGHADTTSVRNKPKYNINLAAQRAIEVFIFLKDLGIDPAHHLMSATSFGEYKPVQRKDSDMDYNSSRLAEDNEGEDKLKRNRRIEIVLIYRRTY
ncbi:MAG: hypothetical protein BWK78_00580 [Thiotrichaceae bacterium IS1]|nr:MAG: hypothetical protein BWK78_00580 [Thiotrichaceae bacterium IS1]